MLEHHRRDPGGEAVEAVEVHAVGRAGDHEVGIDDEEDHPDQRAREGEIDVAKSRTKEMNGEAGVRYWSLGNCSARTAKMTPTMAWPSSATAAQGCAA